MTTERTPAADPTELLDEEVLEAFAADTDQTPEEIKARLRSIPMPDPEDLETVPAEEFYGDS